MTDTGWKPCPMPGCSATCQAKYCCCRRCWRGLPMAVRVEIQTRWDEVNKSLGGSRPLRRRRGNGERMAAIGAYRMAVENAREFYARKRGPGLTARP